MERFRKIIAYIVWMAAAVAALNWTTAVGAVAAAAGVVLALILANLKATARLRLSAVWLLAGGGLLFAAMITWLERTYNPAALFLPTDLSYQIGEALFWFTAVVPVVAAIRISAERSTIFRLSEILLLLAIFITPLAAHRDGFVNRPFEVVDALMSHGWDPLPVFFAVGALMAAIVAVWLAVARESRWYSLAFVLLLILGCFLALPSLRVKQLLRAAGGSSQGGSSSDDDLDFKNQNKNPQSTPEAVVIFRSDYTPAEGAYYFRQGALSRFNGKRLVRDTSGKLDPDIPNGLPTSPIHLIVDRHDSVRTTVALIRPHPRPLALVNATGIEDAPNPDPLRFERSYAVESSPVVAKPKQWVRFGVGSPTWNDAEREAFMEMPQDPRYAELVERIFKETPIDLNQYAAPARAIAIKLWLDDHVTYSKKTSASGDDPVGAFLFGDMHGYCVHFAHAAAMLYRAAGVPSRVATGYLVPAKRRGNGSSLLIMSTDSHAWPEIYLQGVGWMPLDISPSKTDEPAPPEPDRDLQSYLGEDAHNKPPELPNDKGKDLHDKIAAAARLAGKSLLWALAALVVVCYGIKIYRALNPRWCAIRRLPVAAYRAALDRFAEAGRYRGFGESREVFAMATGGPAMQQLTHHHLAAALGKGAPALERTEWLKLVAQATREGTGNCPRWRTILGILNPFSWRKAS